MILLLVSVLLTVAQNESQLESLQKAHFPRIEGSTLYIYGKIDSHIYDYLAYSEALLGKVDTVSLNSLGGNHDWAMQIARRLKDLKIKTKVEEGNYCASSCVYLFMAGEERWLYSTSWLGIHGARLGQNYRIQFINQCQRELKNASSHLSKECLDILASWYSVSFEATRTAFEWMSSQGADPRLFEIYMNFEDVPDWLEYGNVLQKPDWVITAPEALSLSLATHLMPR